MDAVRPDRTIVKENAVESDARSTRKCTTGVGLRMARPTRLFPMLSVTDLSRSLRFTKTQRWGERVAYVQDPDESLVMLVK